MVDNLLQHLTKPQTSDCNQAGGASCNEKRVTQTFWLDSEIFHGRWVAFRIPGLKACFYIFGMK